MMSRTDASGPCYAISRFTHRRPCRSHHPRIWIIVATTGGHLAEQDYVLTPEMRRPFEEDLVRCEPVVVVKMVCTVR